MARRRLQRPWAQKADRQVNIDWNNPLSQGLQNCFLFDGTLRDIAKGLQSLSLIGDAAFDVGPDGRHVTLDGIGDFAATPAAYTDLTGLSELTILSFIRLDTLGTNNSADDGGLFCTGDLADAGNILFWYNVNANATGDKTYSFNVGDANVATNRINGSVGIAAANRVQAVAGVMDGSARRLFVDGVLDAEHNSATQTVVGIVNLYHELRLGGWAFTTNYDLAGDLIATLVFTRALSSGEIRSLSDNPYQILKPRTIWVPVGVPIPLTATVTASIEALAGTSNAATPSNEALHWTARATSSAIEALRELAQSATAPVEALTGIQQAAKPAIEALGYTAITATQTLPIEAMAMINAQALAAYESLAGIDRVSTHEFEALMRVAQTASPAAEALANIDLTILPGIEALTGISRTAQPAIETLGAAAVVATAVIPLEAKGDITRAQAIAVESLHTVSAETSISTEALQAINAGLSVPIESLAYVAHTADGHIEVLATISAAAVAGLESLHALAGTATLPVEALRIIARTAGISLEALQGSTVNVILNIQEGTAWFALRLDADAEFGGVVPTDITFH